MHIKLKPASLTYIWWIFFACLMLALFVLPKLQGIDPFAISLMNLFSDPSAEHLAGTDELGRDILSRLSLAVQTSVFVGVCVLLLAGSIGTAVGVLSGWFGGRIDQFLMRITDVFLSFPGILIAICFAALAGPGVENVIFALGLMGWVSFARLARVQTMAVKNQEYMQAASLSGVKVTQRMFRYILPNIAAPLLIESIFTVAGAILSEAGLSFLGIGIQPPEPSLGSMLKEGTRYMLSSPHLVLMPGLVLMSLILSLNILGDYLRDRLDVRYSK